MPIDVVMPKLSDTMEEGTLLKWLKHPGDLVHKGDAIAEVETDKANMEVEAFEEGTLDQILVEEGQSAPVGQPIARLAGANETPSNKQKQEEPAAETQDSNPPVEEASSSTTKTEQPTFTAKQPSAQTEQETNDQPTQSAPQKQEQPRTTTEQTSSEASTAEETSVDSKETAQVLPPSKRREKYLEESAGSSVRISASPRARKIAEEQGVDLSQIQGSGPEGRIVEADVQNALSKQPTQGQESAPQASTSQDGEEELSKIRKTIAERMSDSKQQIPHFYVTSVVRADALVRLRNELKQQTDISYNDLVIKACALSLRRHPRLNASYREGNIHWNTAIHIAIAVAIPDGLITPIIPNTDELTLPEIAEHSREVTSRAHSNSLQSKDLTGGTFTISNMGMYEVEQFSAIINPPQAAILAVGAIRQVPVVENGVVIPGQELRLQLSADHRLINGVEAAEFMKTLKDFLENPVLLSEIDLQSQYANTSSK